MIKAEEIRQYLLMNPSESADIIRAVLSKFIYEYEKRGFMNSEDFITLFVDKLREDIAGFRSLDGKN